MSIKMLGLILIVMLLPLTVSLQDDPCNNYRMLYDDGGRSIKCDLYYSDSHDRFIDEGWRRVQLESTGDDLTMPTMCVPSGFCGSHSNVWLDGTHSTVEDGIVDRIGCLSNHPTVEDGKVDRMGCLSIHPTVEDGIVDRMGCLSIHPTVEDGIVDRMGCLSNHPTVEDGIVDRIGCLSMFSSCCKVKYPIQIKNCTDYMVYNLKRTLGSDQRYCFDLLVLILGVSLSITMTLLITLVFGVFFYMRQGIIGQKYESIKA
ncbi:hypothetical protein LOTGIDRAFT_237270 [Lottia gigantea]|uniref:UMOD/GP2/OIT3-like D8C domain-containing protein n=1 Tax=Lottia gigantea TaxID=225164 RepID=V4B365_LOTGI|nr:hypothetical protein LOTGIDRAFT_237270 [Lottia gigantea]ESP04738.1 hypothetical protein LOTGIDRAFT_237270 [Lottia gigantea]